jgi:hypothetical protein
MLHKYGGLRYVSNDCFMNFAKNLPEAKAACKASQHADFVQCGTVSPAINQPKLKDHHLSAVHQILVPLRLLNFFYLLNSSSRTIALALTHYSPGLNAL